MFTVSDDENKLMGTFVLNAFYLFINAPFETFERK
jgi:hypothetical protein